MIMPEKTTSVDFPGCKGLTFELTFLGKEKMTKLVKRCNKPKYDSRTHQAREELDSDLFAKLLTKATIKGWSGFKLEYLEKFVPLQDDADLDAELDYTEGNAEELMNNSVSFESWVTEVITNLENFTQAS